MKNEIAVAENKLIMGRDEGKSIALLGNTVRIKLGSELGDGQLAVIDYTLAAGGPCPPPHRHNYIEVFYVLEGQVTFLVEGEVVTRAAGTTVVVPAGVVHAFSNDTAETARFLVICSPAGIDRYFEELGAYLQTQPTWPPRDMSAMAALNLKYGTEVVAGAR